MAISTSISSNISTSISTSISSGDEGGWSGLTFTSTGTSTIWLNNNNNNPNCEYSLDKGKTWTTMPTTSTGAISFSQIWVRGNNSSGWSTSYNNSSQFRFLSDSDDVKASGSVMSLLDNKGISKVIPCDYCFVGLFTNQVKLIQAPKLPATALTQYCYYRTFYGCNRLTEAPALPALTTVKYCYTNMFNSCTALKSVTLPATTLTQNCYESMFTWCTSLESIHIAAVDTSAPNCLLNWLANASTDGTLYTPAYYAGYAQDSTSGCPSGWTRVDAIPAPDTTVFHTMHVNSASSAKVCGNSNKLEAVYVNGQSRELDNSQSLKAGYNHVTLVYGQSLTSLSMERAFDSCTAIIQCDLSHLTKYPITSIHYLFEVDKYMENVIGFENLNLSSITNPGDADCVFQGCEALKHLPFNPTLKVLGEAYSNHNYVVEDEEIIIPKCVTTIVPEHNFYGLGSESYDETAQRYKVHTFALEEGHSSNLSIGEKGELYCIYNGKKTLVSVPQGWLLENNTFNLSSDCQCLGNLSLSRNYALQKLVLPDEYEMSRIGYGDNHKGSNTGSGIHIAAYTYCSLNHIEVSATNPRYSTNDGLLLSKDGSELICVPWYWPNTNTQNPQPLNIPSSVTKIGVGAFADGAACRCISEINIGPQVTYIDPEQCGTLSANFASKVNIDPNNAYYEKVNGKIVFKQSHLLTMTVTSPVQLYFLKKDSSVSCEWSTDGTTWTDFPTASTTIQNGTYYLRGTNTNLSGSHFRQDVAGGSFSLSGNLGSLLDGAGKLPFVSNGYAFIELFYHYLSQSDVRTVPALTNLRNLYLPFARTSTGNNSQYMRTFDGCGAKELPSLDWSVVWPNTLAQAFNNLVCTASQADPVKLGINAYYYEGTYNGITTGKYINVYTHGNMKGCTLNQTIKTLNEERPISEYPVTKYTPDFLKFTSTGSSTISLTQVGTYSGTWPIETSSDGSTWTSYTLGTSISLSDGQYVYFRGQKDNTSQSGTNYRKFTMSGSISASGDCTSLLNGVGGVLDLTQYGTGVFRYMFLDCSVLTKVPALPSTILTVSCYSNMFKGCTSLTSASSLPATSLNTSCYQDMFNGCTSLVTSPPSLPATTLANYCYYYMFFGCTAMTTAPALPATTLVPACYLNMFYGCTSLTSAPALPATTLAASCYYNMFYGCTSLTSAPALPATTLAASCYYNMFQNCTKLTGPVLISATTAPASAYTASMFANSGTARPATPTDYNKIKVGGNVSDWNSTNAGINSTYWTVELITE